MAGMPTKLPEEQGQVSTFETVFLISVVTFLCAIFGFVLVILGYCYTLLFGLDSEEFSNYTFVYFSISLAIWSLIGILTPFVYFKDFFEELKGLTFERAIVFIIVVGIFIVMYWYILTFAAQVIVSVFGIE